MTIFLGLRFKTSRKLSAASTYISLRASIESIRKMYIIYVCIVIVVDALRNVVHEIRVAHLLDVGECRDEDVLAEVVDAVDDDDCGSTAQGDRTGSVRSRVEAHGVEGHLELGRRADEDRRDRLHEVVQLRAALHNRTVLKKK